MSDNQTTRHRPTTRYSVDDGISSHATEADALAEAASWTDPTLEGQPVDMYTFEVCEYCGPLELVINARDDYEDSLWPCAAVRAAGRDARARALLGLRVELSEAQQR